jgi:hypothetical protein
MISKAEGGTVAALLVSLLLSVQTAGQRTQTFTGVVIDDMCATVGHDRMQMGPTDRECTIACVMAHGSSYVLEDGKTVYKLSDQKLPQEFAGQRVRVVGTLDAKNQTIQVQSITAAQ